MIETFFTMPSIPGILLHTTANLLLLAALLATTTCTTSLSFRSFSLLNRYLLWENQQHIFCPKICYWCWPNWNLIDIFALASTSTKGIDNLLRCSSMCWVILSLDLISNIRFFIHQMTNLFLTTQSNSANVISLSVNCFFNKFLAISMCLLTFSAMWWSSKSKIPYKFVFTFHLTFDLIPVSFRNLLKQ